MGESSRGLRRPEPGLSSEDIQVALGHTDAERQYALALTAEIRRTAERLSLLVEEAHRKRVHAILGYPSWDAYVRDNFDFGRKRAYQLIYQARVIREIEAVSGLSVDINERRARRMKSVLPEVLSQMRELIDAGHAPEQVVAAVIAYYGSPTRSQAKAMALIPGAASAVAVQTGVRPDEDPDFAKQIEGINRMISLPGCELPSPDFVDTWTDEDLKRVQASIVHTEKWLGAFRRRIDET